MGSLAKLPIGKEGEVASLHLPEAVRTRFIELGLTPSCRVRCLYAAPSGDPRAYLVRGAVLAIRKKDAEAIEVNVWD